MLSKMKLEVPNKNDTFRCLQWQLGRAHLIFSDFKSFFRDAVSAYILCGSLQWKTELQQNSCTSCVLSRSKRSLVTLYVYVYANGSCVLYFSKLFRCGRCVKCKETVLNPICSTNLSLGFCWSIFLIYLRCYNIKCVPQNNANYTTLRRHKIIIYLLIDLT